MAIRVKVEKTLIVDGNWGDYAVETSFNSTFEREYINFPVKINEHCMLTIPELREILAFAESEYERLLQEPVE